MRALPARPARPGGGAAGAGSALISARRAAAAGAQAENAPTTTTTPPTTPPGTDSLAASLRVALADRSTTSGPAVAAARALLARLAASGVASGGAIAPLSPAVASLADALAGATARGGGGSLAANASLLHAFATLNHATLASKELAVAVGRQAREALAAQEEATAQARLATAGAAATAARAAAGLGWAPGGVWLDGVLAALTALSNPCEGHPALAAAWADALEACLAARHAPGQAPAVRCSLPSTAPRIASCLALLGYGGDGLRSRGGHSTNLPPLAAALRARVLGAPRGAVAPTSVAAAAVALGAWGCLEEDEEAVATVLDHLGVVRAKSGLLIPPADAVPVWAAVRTVAAGLSPSKLSPRGARALAGLRDAGRKAAAAAVADGPPPAALALQAAVWAAFPAAATVTLTPPDGEAAFLFAVMVDTPTGGLVAFELGPPGDASTNAPTTTLGFGAAMRRRGSDDVRSVVIGRHEMDDAAALAARLGEIAAAQVL